MIRDLNVQLNKSCESGGEGVERIGFETEGPANCKGWRMNLRDEKGTSSVLSRSHRGEWTE